MQLAPDPLTTPSFSIRNVSSSRRPTTACTANCASRYSVRRTLSTVLMGVRASAMRYMTTVFMRKLVRFEIMGSSLFDATDQS